MSVDQVDKRAAMGTLTFRAASAFCEAGEQWEHYQMYVSENKELSERMRLKERDETYGGKQRSQSVKERDFT